MRGRVVKLFYCAGKPHSFVSKEGVQQVIRHDREVLAERDTATRIVWGDKQASVLGAVGLEGSRPIRYSAYGGNGAAANLPGLIGYAGYYVGALSGHYILGNGYRSYSPRMMRFLSPDSLSPFERGGLNAYGYCAGDPINRVDDNGRFWGEGLRVEVVKFNVGKIHRAEVRRKIASAGGSVESTVKVARLNQAFTEDFDGAPMNELRIEDMADIKSLVLYRSMQNAKRAYVGGAVYRIDAPGKGMFTSQYNEVRRMLGKLQETGSIAEYQRVDSANMRKIDNWLAEMKKNRDVEAIRLAGLLERPE